VNAGATRAQGARHRRAKTVAGLALFGDRGRRGSAARRRLAPASTPDVGDRLMTAVADAARRRRHVSPRRLRRSRARHCRALLRHHGFKQEARIPGFYRDGVASLSRLPL
jgi:hypothetical protein